MTPDRDTLARETRDLLRALSARGPSIFVRVGQFDMLAEECRYCRAPYHAPHRTDCLWPLIAKLAEAHDAD